MEQQKIFFIMPFTDHFFEVYETIKRESSNDFIFSHAATSDNHQSIIKDIVKSIWDADVIIANLTDLNPNVFYELGIAHTLNKKVIIITENIDSLPFDLKSYRAIEYGMEYVKFDNLIKSLKSSLERVSSNSIAFSNPVIDNLRLMNINNLSFIIDSKDEPISLIDSDKGFLDFLADIQDNMDSFTTNLTNMATDMNQMTADVSNSADQMLRIQKSKTGNQSKLIQGEAKKVAGYIKTFDEKLQKYNDFYINIWDKIENDILGLIDNKYSGNDNNKPELMKFLKSIVPLREAIDGNCKTMENLKSSLSNMLGLEKTLTQSVSILKIDLKSYINIILQIDSSVCRIIEKGSLVVGPIEADSEV